MNSVAGQVIATFVDRQDGKLYSALWEQAIADRPDWVLINSFNQWHSGTEIEPSVELGDRYIKLTAEMAARFRAGTGPKSEGERAKGKGEGAGASRKSEGESGKGKGESAGASVEGGRKP